MTHQRTFPSARSTTRFFYSTINLHFHLWSLAVASPSQPPHPEKQHRAENVAGLHLPAQQGRQDHCMISIVRSKCVGWGRNLHLCNGGAGALHCQPRVRNRAGRHRGVEEVRKAREHSEREREMRGKGESLHSNTHTRQKHSGSPPPTTHTPTPWGNNTHWKSLFILAWMASWPPALHFTKCQEQYNTELIMSDQFIKPFPPGSIHSAHQPINDQAPTSYQTISTNLGWAESPLNNKCGSTALK